LFEVIKMKNTQEKKMENDNLAAIGIGAMIVFIALILVAAVAAAVIIQTAEKLQQNAQSTGDDTTDEMSGKVQILNVFVDDPDNSYVVYFRLAAGSDDTAASDTPGDGGTSIIFELSDDAATPTEAATAEAGVAYRVSLDADVTSGTPAVTNDCSPSTMFADNVRATLYVHVVGGGSTYEVLKVNDASRGAVVV
jgi:archaellin